jgi:hypothetical protein
MVRFNLASDDQLSTHRREPHALRSHLLHDFHDEEPSESSISRRLFQIRMADSSGARADAGILVNKMYAKRGYRLPGFSAQQPRERVTLVASERDIAVGTITIGFDAPHGLLVDELFAAETRELRDRGDRVCEFTKLAMDAVVRSRRVLASLFHVAYIYSHRVMGVDHLLIEVNPRHAGYYRRMLGFEIIGPQRLNHRVNAPAILLSLDFRHARSQIERFGGNPAAARNERSLYPFFFSLDEETGIARRMRGEESPRTSYPGHPLYRRAPSAFAGCSP